MLSIQMLALHAIICTIAKVQCVPAQDLETITTVDGVRWLPNFDYEAGTTPLQMRGLPHAQS